jgi:hypothetical protein
VVRQYAPAYKPEIAMVALIENSGFGGDTRARSSRRLRRLLSQDAPRRTAGRSANTDREERNATARERKPPAAKRSRAAARQQTAVNNQ